MLFNNKEQKNTIISSICQERGLPKKVHAGCGFSGKN
jgi:hypothetical protein